MRWNKRICNIRGCKDGLSFHGLCSDHYFRGYLASKDAMNRFYQEYGEAHTLAEQGIFSCTENWIKWKNKRRI